MAAADVVPLLVLKKDLRAPQHSQARVGPLHEGRSSWLRRESCVTLPGYIVGLYNRHVDVDRLLLAGQLDDVVIELRRLTLNRSGLSLTAAATLTTLRRSGPSRLTDLAVTEGVSQPSMTALVARLADSGLVQRGTDPHDRRAVLIALTPAGADLLDRRRDDRAARLAGPLDELDDDDVRAITAALPALARLAGARIPSRTGGSS